MSLYDNPIFLRGMMACRKGVVSSGLKGSCMQVTNHPYNKVARRLTKTTTRSSRPGPGASTKTTDKGQKLDTSTPFKQEGSIPKKRKAPMRDVQVLPKKSALPGRNEAESGAFGRKRKKVVKESREQEAEQSRIDRFRLGFEAEQEWMRGVEGFYTDDVGRKDYSGDETRWIYDEDEEASGDGEGGDEEASGDGEGGDDDDEVEQEEAESEGEEEDKDAVKEEGKSEEKDMWEAWEAAKGPVKEQQDIIQDIRDNLMAKTATKLSRDDIRSMRWNLNAAIREFQRVGYAANEFTIQTTIGTYREADALLKDLELKALAAKKEKKTPNLAKSGAKGQWAKGSPKVASKQTDVLSKALEFSPPRPQRKGSKKGPTGPPTLIGRKVSKKGPTGPPTRTRSKTGVNPPRLEQSQNETVMSRASTRGKPSARRGGRSRGFKRRTP
jgi:hypothetical protein